MCYQCVDEKCPKCNCPDFIKNGKSRNSTQRYRCKDCSHSFQLIKRYKACKIEDGKIVQLVNENVGIRSVARILKISASTVIRRILKNAKSLKRPQLLIGKTYQVDEIFTYIGNKENRVCIAYSIEAETGNVVDIVVGRRNKTNLRKITSTLVLAGATKITTDKLNIYKELIPKEIHSTKFRGINKIERSNLNLRTHLKRLNRKTISFSKSVAMLLAVVKIYFWGEF